MQLLFVAGTSENERSRFWIEWYPTIPVATPIMKDTQSHNVNISGIKNYICHLIRSCCFPGFVCHELLSLDSLFVEAMV